MNVGQGKSIFDRKFIRLTQKKLTITFDDMSADDMSPDDMSPDAKLIPKINEDFFRLKFLWKSFLKCDMI